MMSGSNPFRHKKPVVSNNSIDSPQPSHQPRSANRKASLTNADGPSHTPSPRPKIVRIASPPVDAHLSRYTSSDFEDPDDLIPTTFKNLKTRPGSPPPASFSQKQGEGADLEDDDSAEDPFNPDGSGSEEQDENNNNKEGVIGWSTNTTTMRVDQGQGRVIRGEHRTDEPVTTTTFSGLQRSFSQGPSDEPGLKDGIGMKGKRATMDVDAFKRLLMTGDAGDGSGMDAPAHSQAASAGENSVNNAGTTSLPRQGTFGSPPHVAGEVHPASHGQSTSEADDERRKASQEKKQKPPPPKTRHGKPTKETAGLASPISSSTPLPSSSSPSTSTSTSSPPSSTRGGASGHIKPHSEAAPSSTTTSQHQQNQAQTEPQTTSPPQLKRAPTPPIARRHSQMKHHKTALSRSNSNRLSLPPSSTSLDSAFSQQHPSSPLRTPPPPPSRRAGAGTDPHSHPFSMADVPSRLRSPFSSESGAETPQQQQHQQQQNNIDLSRMPTDISNNKLSRTSSTRSATAPRPPPPRRAGVGSASRTSMDEVRPTNVLGGKPAVGGMAVGAENTPSSNAKGILDDLSKLQREVDELRGQYDRRPEKER